MKIKQVTKAHNQRTKEPEIQQNYSAWKVQQSSK